MGTEPSPPRGNNGQNGHWNFDEDLEGVRSLGAVLDDWGLCLAG